MASRDHGGSQEPGSPSGPRTRALPGRSSLRLPSGQSQSPQSPFHAAAAARSRSRPTRRLRGPPAPGDTGPQPWPPAPGDTAPEPGGHWAPAMATSPRGHCSRPSHGHQASAGPCRNSALPSAEPCHLQVTIDTKLQEKKKFCLDTNTRGSRALSHRHYARTARGAA